MREKPGSTPNHAVTHRTSREALAAALEGLDESQAAAARAGDGGNLVRAGAGTGKTRTLVARVAHLVGERGESPSGIVLATFTNKAASEIRNRLAPLLGEEGARQVRMGTFHSLGARLLRRHPHAGGLARGFSVIDEDDVRRILRDAVTQGGHVPAGTDPSEIVDAASRQIRQWKSWGLRTGQVEQAGRDRRSDEAERLARVYVAYQHELSRRNLADFGDLVLSALGAMLDDAEVAHQESSAVRHLLVDEAQDANPTQVRFARELSAAHRNVFAVGDEDQSVFSFQGGYPEAIGNLAGPGAREFALTANRRCTDEILAPAVGLVNLNKRRVRKVLRSGVPGGQPGVEVLASERAEGDKVAERVAALVAGGAEPSEIAVLARSAFALHAVEEAMIKARIPYEVTGGQTFVDREEVRDVTAYLRLAVDPHDALAFERVANRPTRGIGPQALEALLSSQARTGEPFHETCANLTSMAGVRLTGNHREGLDSLARALQGLREAYEGDVDADAVVGMILNPNGIGYLAFVESQSKDKTRRRRLESLAAMRRIAREEPDVVMCLERIVLSAEADVAQGEGIVRLSTMHSAKGLEWDHVLCVGFDAGVIPSPRSLDGRHDGVPGDPWDGPAGGGIEEERRLAHVAFTRARKTLDVTAPLSRAGKPVKPSRFLAESGLDPFASMDPFEGRAKAMKKGSAGFGRRSGMRGAR